MIQGKTESGFEFTVCEDIAKDSIVLKYLTRTAADPTAVFSLIDRMVELGLDEPALYEHCKREDGIAPVDAVAKEAIEIIKITAKNS